MFNIDKFKNAAPKRRTEVIKDMGLQDFGDDGIDPEITVQSLSGSEVALAVAHMKKHKEYKHLVDSPNEKIVKVLDSVLGINDKVPEEFVYQRWIVVSGMVDPKFDYEQVKKFSQFYPTQFYHIYNVINRLTGLGATLGE